LEKLSPTAAAAAAAGCIARFKSITLQALCSVQLKEIAAPSNL
jgi:hypothetical protein